MKSIFVLMVCAAVLSAVEPLVSGKWLLEHIDDTNLVLVDVSDASDYTEAHIPGAMHSPTERWQHDKGVYVGLRPLGEIEKEMRRLGIDAGSKVVIYGDFLSKKHLMRACYILWAMEVAGFENSAMLDGGISAYLDAGGGLEEIPQPDRHGDYVAYENTRVYDDLASVQSSLGAATLIDARPGTYYFGAKRPEGVPRAGHIDGAKSYFWQFSLNDDGSFKSEDELASMLGSGLGLGDGRRIIVYCTAGLKTSVNFFVLHRLLRYKNVGLYDGSMKEWASREDTPVTSFRWE